MLISHFVQGVRSDLASLGGLGGEQFEDFAGRLGDAAGPALRARLLEALDTIIAQANADEDRHDLRLGFAGDEVTLVLDPVTSEVPDAPGEFTARFALRLPEDLKSRIEQLAQRSGASANSWIVRTLAKEVADSAVRTTKRAGHQLRGTGRS